MWKKMEGSLAQPACRTITADPINKLNVRFIQTLKRIKRDTDMGNVCIMPCTLLVALPPGNVCIMPCTLLVALPPKFYGLSKIHKTGTPLGLLHLAGSLLLMVWLKSLPRYLSPLYNKSPHHIQSTHDFVRLGRLLSFWGCASVHIMLLHCLHWSP